MRKNTILIMGMNLLLLWGCSSGVELKTVSVNHDEIGTIGVPIEWDVELRDGWSYVVLGDSIVAVERFFGQHYHEGLDVIVDTRIYNSYFAEYLEIEDTTRETHMYSNDAGYYETGLEHSESTVTFWSLWLLGLHSFATEFVFVDTTIEDDVIERIAKSYNVTEAVDWS